MKEYIERATILQAIEESEPDVMADYGEYYGSEWGFSRSKLSEIIRGMPTADVVEVRHGRWEKHPQSNEDDPVYTCSLCKLNVSGFEKRWIKYCPNCGACMDKEDEHE